MRPWRLIVDDAPADGAWNMALDRAIQVARVAGDVPATVRFYGWARPTVTLGRFQDLSGIDLEECALRGVEVVRRFTGGRGVLHYEEMTYSVVASVEDGVPRTTTASYRHLCSALLETYRRLGVLDTALTERDRGTPGAASCYLHASRADLSYGMRKLSGSAQVWMGDTVLQHGSVTITRDTAREAAVFRLTPEQVAALERSTATLADVCTDVPSVDEVRRLAVGAFEEALQVRLEPGTVTPAEERTARSLQSDLVLETSQ